MSTSPTSPLLLFEQVSKWYGSVLGLNQVTLELRGGITGLVGPNGAGKSTLIKLATGQVAPSLGQVQIAGIQADAWQARRLVGYCPDHDAFYEEMNGREFIRTLAKLTGYPSREAIRRTEEVLAEVGMIDRADRKLRGYSKGMRQRIKLAQALLHDPKLLILDEPLSGIDPVGRRELLQLFRDLAQRGKCLLISSHELEELEKLTNHIIIMARGRIAAVGTLEQIRTILNDYPTSLRIVSEQARHIASQLLLSELVLGVDFHNPKIPGTPGSEIVVRAKNPQQFFAEFQTRVTQECWDIRELEPLDDSTHAILGYVLGGSGKT